MSCLLPERIQVLDGRGGVGGRMEPLLFAPYLRPMVWGGRRLREVLDKPLPEEGTWGESWEISVHPTHESRVAEGPFAGRSLTELCREQGAELFGSAWRPGMRFPLLLKYLDACDWLSVQVHPDDARAPRLAGEPLGKTEAWLVLDVQPGGRIFAGLRPGVDRPTLEEAIESGRSAECLHAFTPSVGDCIFLPAGTVHAVGGGVLLAEVQQSSDATLRLYDWDRPGSDGRPRPLHIVESLEAIAWDAGPVHPVRPTPLPAGEQLVRCPYFHLDRFRLIGQLSSPYEGTLSLWMVLSGAAELRARGYQRSCRRGETVLVPATAQEVQWFAPVEAILLGVTLP